MSFDGKAYNSGGGNYQGTRVKILYRLIHEGINKLHVNTNVYKGRYTDIWIEGYGSHGKRV